MLDRRRLLSCATGTVLTANPWQSASARSLTKQEWLDVAVAEVNTKGIEQDALRLGRFRDPIYFLLSPIEWRPGENDDPTLPHVTVPTGFVTDLASIPRVFWSLLRPDGDYVYAAIVHDFLYWTQTTSRAAADTVLKIGMRDFDVPLTAVTAIYQAVHLGGQSAWADNAKLKSRGERRVLTVFPDDPKTSWAQWKAQPRVFGS